MECLICQNVTESEYLEFCGTAICSDCELRLMELAVDEPGYDLQVRAFNLFWQRQFLAARDRHQLDGEYV